MWNPFRKKLKVMLLDEYAFIPSRAHDDDAGLDLHSPYHFVILPHTFKSVDLGFAMAIPKGYGGFINARSGLGTKHGIRPRNCTGVIDSSYRGCVTVTLENASEIPYTINRGDRIAQLIIQKVGLMKLEQVDSLDETHRGTGGFGSTGK